MTGMRIWIGVGLAALICAGVLLVLLGPGSKQSEIGKRKELTTPEASEIGKQMELTTPEATVAIFTKAVAEGDVDSAMSCCLPNGHDYDDIKEVLTASPSSPMYDMRRMFEAIDPEAPVHVISVDIEGEKATIVWRVTFKRDFHTAREGGHTFKAGSTFDLDGTLRKSGNRWLIEGI